jgi:hypothetical protein
MLPDDDPRLGHSVDLRDPAGPRGGRYRSDDLLQPEHRIDSSDVLVARRG